MRVLRTALLLALAATLAACADTGAPSTDSDRNEEADAVGAGPDNDGMTAGGWQSAADDGGQSVAFRSRNGELLFAIACDVRGGLLFERHGLVPRGNLGLMQLRTGGDVRRLAATAASDGEPQVQARAPYNDQLIPALMRFEGPLEVRIEGLETLMLPPSPAVRELTQRCQRGGRPPAAAAPATPAEAG